MKVLIPLLFVALAAAIPANTSSDETKVGVGGAVNMPPPPPLQQCYAQECTKETSACHDNSNCLHRVCSKTQCRFCPICKGHRDGAAALGVREDAAIEQAGGHLDDGAESEVNEAAIAKPPPRLW